MIGLYVQHDTLRAVDIVRKSQGYVLNGIAEEQVQLPEPDRIRPLENDEVGEYIRYFVAALNALFSVKGFSGKEIAVAIDIRNAFIHTVPFNGDFSAGNVKRLIEWELSLYFPDMPANAFLYDTYNPGYNPAKDKSPRFIYTAVPRSYIHLLQRGIRETGMKLVSINVDQFTLENVLKLAATDKKRERLNVIGFRYGNILYCSLLWNYRLVRYREYILDEIYSPERRLEMFLASMSGPQKNIERRIYYHPYDESITDTVEQNTGWEFDRFKAFDKLQLSRKVRMKYPTPVLMQESFAPAVSVALRSE
jgi:hypothetical protein